MTSGLASAFLSYSRSNGQFVDDLARHLIERHWVVWVDRQSLYAGDRWPRRLGEAIVNETNQFVLVWSREAAKSDFVDLEWNIAVAAKKHISILKLDDQPLPWTLIPYQAHSVEDAATAARWIREAPVTPVKSAVLKRLEAAPDSDPAAVRSAIHPIARRPVFWLNLALLLSGVAGMLRWVQTCTSWDLTRVNGLVVGALAAICAGVLFLVFGAGYKEQIRRIMLPILGTRRGTLAVGCMWIACLIFTATTRTIEVRSPAEGIVTLEWGKHSRRIPLAPDLSKREVLYWAVPFRPITVTVSQTCRLPVIAPVDAYSVPLLSLTQPKRTVVIRGNSEFLEYFRSRNVDALNLEVVFNSRTFTFPDYRGGVVALGDSGCVDVEAIARQTCLENIGEVEEANAKFSCQLPSGCGLVTKREGSVLRSRNWSFPETLTRTACADVWEIGAGFAE